MTTFSGLKSIESFFTLINEAIKDSGVQFVYENENLENPNWQSGIVELGVNKHDVYATKSVLAVEPITTKEQQLGMVADKQYLIENCNDIVTVKIYGSNDVVYDTANKIKGMLNGALSDKVFKSIGLQMFSVPKQQDFNIDVNTGGATVRCLLIEYSVIYSLVNQINDDVDVTFYEKLELDKKEIEE